MRPRYFVCQACCVLHFATRAGGGIADNKKAEAKASAEHLVAPTGFEPATFALRGRRPKPLDDGAIKRIYQNGWGGRSRTLTYGTRNRCPTIRRHPNELCVAFASLPRWCYPLPRRESVYYGSGHSPSTPYFEKFSQFCEQFTKPQVNVV